MSLLDRAREAALCLSGAGRVVVCTHIDADGISAGAVAKRSLERAGVPCEVCFLKQLDPPAIESLRAEAADVVWFCDLGAGQWAEISDLRAVVTDHHVPRPPNLRPHTTGQTNLDAFVPTDDRVIMVNPMLDGYDGSVHLSGAGATYLVARAMDRANVDLAPLAIVGAVGDLQDQRSRALTGPNRDEILRDAVDGGLVRAERDVALFGRTTRSLGRFLLYADDPPLGFADLREAESWLEAQGVPVRDGERRRVWADLGADERRCVVSALVRRLLDRGTDPAAVERLVGECYTLVGEPPPLSDAKEYATILNGCGRYDRADVGLAVCLGDRGEALATAQGLMNGHRRNLQNKLQVLTELGITQRSSIQYFDAGDRIQDTVVGIVAGMALNSRIAGVDPGKPMVGFAEVPGEGMVKVSVRSLRELVGRGLDLSKAVGEAARAVGGEGGGHAPAAGASIPKGTEQAFLDRLEEGVRSQLGG